jgi:DNA repair exonuclease SbcCD ATPase subunit
LLATLADNGLKGSIAGTGLSKTFIELNKKGIPLNEALERVKNSSNALNEAIDLVGVVGAKSLLTLANNAPKIDVLTESFRNSQGAAQRLAETRLDNLAGDTTKLGSAWEGFLLSIEDGEGLFNSIARGIVQATTSLLNFITPTEKLSESLEKERASLFRVQAQLGNVNTTQEERTSLILELQKQYPNYLKNIDAETASNEDLNAAIQEINKSLINKILIQEREEEIQEQAEETADQLNKVLDKEAETLDYTAKLRQKYSDLGIEIKATSPNEVLAELNEIQERENKLRLEGNGQNKLKIGQLSQLSKEHDNLFFKIKALNKAEEDFQEEQEKGNNLIKEKDALMERLGITTDNSTDKTKDNTEGLDDNLEAIDEVEKKTRDLILLKQQELKEIQNTEAKTRDEIAARNDKVKAIQAEIKELQNLSLKKLNIERLDTESLPKLQKREAQKIEVRTSSEEQVNRYVRKVNDNYTSYFRNQSEERKRIILQENAARLDITSNVLSSVENLTRAFGERNEENAKKAFNVQKALGIAQVGINTASAIMKVAAETTDPTPVQAFRVGNMIAMGVAGAAQIAAIAMQKFQPSGGTASTTTPSFDTSGGGAATSPTQPPSFNVVGQSGFNQVAGALGQQQPVQAFVVAGDVTTAQQLQNNTITQATF